VHGLSACILFDLIWLVAAAARLQSSAARAERAELCRTRDECSWRTTCLLESSSALWFTLSTAGSCARWRGRRRRRRDRWAHPARRVRDVHGRAAHGRVCAVRAQVRLRGVRAGAGGAAVPRVPPASDRHDEDLRLRAALHYDVCAERQRSPVSVQKFIVTSALHL
jgi:hypothetical protein